MIVSTNPATARENARFSLQDEASVDAVLEAAIRAQRAWRVQAIETRSSLLKRMAAVLRANTERFATLVTQEMGKPIAEAEAEISKCAVTCDFYAENAERLLAPEPVATSAEESMIVGDPLGVVLAIMPWNYPFWQVIRCLVPALLGGNALVLKHANNVPQCAFAAAELMQLSDAPRGLFGILLIENSDVERVIRDPRIAAVSLTGSTQVGSLVGSQAASVLKPQVLELGGSDPFIVLEDADVALAAKMAVKARFSNTGQSCISAKRFIVVPGVAQQFVALFMDHVSRIRAGDPMDRATTLGPMARSGLRDELHRQVVRSVDAGARLLTGGRAIDGDGFFYFPTVLDGVTEGMAAFEEETFGPAAAIVHAADAEDAIRLANRSEFGLSASIWTRDMDAARRYVRRIEAGAVFVNAVVASDARIPFGGIKRSGYGRELGVLGIRSFMNMKTVWFGTREPAINAAAE